MNVPGLIACFAVGAAVGGLISWLAVRARAAVDSERARRADDLERRLEAATAAQKDAEVACARLNETIESERLHHAEKLRTLEAAEARLTDSFKALAGDTLRDANQRFLDLAKAEFGRLHEASKGDLEKRQQAVGELVKPVQETLKKFEENVRKLEETRVGAYEGIKEHIKNLSEAQQRWQVEAANLSKAMRNPNARGRWGEIQLRRVVEMAGMQEHCDFQEQPTFAGADGMLRPDMLVRLPGRRQVVVDAKAPLMAYLEAVECQDDEQGLIKLKQHAQHIRNHVAALAKKSYWDQFDQAPEFVILFLPGEIFFNAAVSHDPELIQSAIEQRVLLSTPTTLIALLKAIAFGWRQEKLEENSLEISRIGKELYERISIVGSHMARVGGSLGSAVKAYNDAVGSLESRLLVSARRLKDCGVASGDGELKTPDVIDHASKPLTAPEFAAAAAEEASTLRVTRPA